MPTPKPLHIVLGGALALSVAMGIGRFAFTPLLPMMLNDGVIDLPQASWLASANYLGYLVGALLCTFQPWLWQLSQRLGRPWSPLRTTWMVRIGLVATCALTLGMSLHPLDLPAYWPALRFAAGVASALVFVYTSGWCLSQVALRGQPAMGALIYTGPGGGIMLSGLAASGMVASHWTAAAGWLVFGLLAVILTISIWPVFSARNTLSAPFRPSAQTPATTTSFSPATAPQPQPSLAELTLLTLAYGFAGFGYIITATFLPVIARQTLSASPLLDLFWPLLGAGVVTGALLASRLRNPGDFRLLLMGCYLVQAAGIAVGLFSPTLPGFASGSLLLGLPFTAITYFAMQEVRRIRPESPAPYMGLLTAVYGIGQIIGPPLTAALLASSATRRAGFDLALEIAAAALVVGAVLYGVLVWTYPVKTAPS